nr:hypothetical protein [Paraburkholderia sacchari]
MFHPGNVDGLANSATSSINNAIKYRSPTWSGLYVAALFGFGNTTHFQYGTTSSLALHYGNGPFEASVFWAMLQIGLSSGAQALRIGLMRSNCMCSIRA